MGEGGIGKGEEGLGRIFAERLCNDDMWFLIRTEYFRVLLESSKNTKMHTLFTHHNQKHRSLSIGDLYPNLFFSFFLRNQGPIFCFLNSTFYWDIINLSMTRCLQNIVCTECFILELAHGAHFFCIAGGLFKCF